MSNLRRALFGLGDVGGGPALGTDLDGANDYLSRSSDFTGNTDSKTFTFSAWVYSISGGGTFVYCADNTTSPASRPTFSVEYRAVQKYLVINGYNGNQQVLANASTLLDYIAEDTWFHILLSVDMAGGYSLYVNDELVPITFGVYVDAVIGFSLAGSHAAGAGSVNHFTAGSVTHGRLADVFLDYTYRDLSIEANRRLFTTIDPDKGLVSVGGDALASLSPIMTAFTDPDDLTLNQGTGGAWTQNGIMTRSNRGVNQFNAAASEFDGGADYLYTTTLPPGSDSTLFSAAFHMKGGAAVSDDDGVLRLLNGSNAAVVSVKWDETPNRIRVILYESDAATAVVALDIIDACIQGKNSYINISLDTSNVSKRHVHIDGEEYTNLNWQIYRPVNIGYSAVINGAVGANGTVGGAEFGGALGNVWHDASYSDLSVNNPFWNSDLNKPKYLGELGELPTGLQPLVYLPLRADDAGKNLGSGGDFTVNSGPFIGARGASEYWARSIVADNSNYLTGSVFCQSLVKWLSVDSGVTWTPTYANAVTVTDIGNGTDNGQVAYYYGTSEAIVWDEASKLRFTDALGYPIPPEIDGDTVLFLEFSDTADFGLNQGSGGDFTETGTITQGADVNG